MDKFKINGKFEVLYVSSTVGERDENLDVFIGADNEEVLHQIGEEYSTYYNIKELAAYQAVTYNGSKYLGFYARLDELFVDPGNQDIMMLESYNCMAAKEMYLRDKVKELHDVVANMIGEIENELELSDPTGKKGLTKIGQDIVSLLHHIECETCI
jgi:hypothetical protein